MPSTRKSQSSRTNGAKSSGPITPEGKSRSSQNSLKHGLHSKQILLPTESAEEFETLRDSYFTQFQPATPLEAELVESLATTRWRIRRLATIESNMLQNFLTRRAAYIPDQLQDSGDEAHLAWSFESIAGGTSMQMLIRYEATLSRTYDRTLKHLQVLQSQRPPGPEAKQQNEPTASAPPPSTPPPNPPTEPRPSGSGQNAPHPSATPSNDTLDSGIQATAPKENHHERYDERPIRRP